MSSVQIKVKKLDNNAIIPQYQTEGAACFDIHALINAPYDVVNPKDQLLVRTGLSFAIPKGYELQIRPRSGLSKKHKITVTNSPGTVDRDYRGEVMVLIYNLGDQPFSISNGDRIAQCAVCPVISAIIEEVEELDETDRGNGGFGSTGV
jgi:dUTP pyrophosphatase